jgi:hypothetical protein
MRNVNRIEFKSSRLPFFTVMYRHLIFCSCAPTKLNRHASRNTDGLPLPSFF